MIDIRDTKIADAKELSACIDKVANERKFLAVNQGFSENQMVQFIEKVQASGGIQKVLASHNEIIGWCDLMIDSREGMGHTAHLGMGILSEFRGQGFGQRLLRAVIGAADDQNIERIELVVFASNAAAVTLYRRAGFVQEGLKRKARKLDGVYDDVVLMGRLRASLAG
jgi:RimJ/RimL family protein N-acetyltransferase